MNRQTFNKGLALLMAAFPEYRGMGGQEGTATLEVYWRYLNDFDDKDFALVVEQTIKTKKYFPKISELREELLHLKGLREDMTAASEWGKLMRAAEAGKDLPKDLSMAAERALMIVGSFDEFKRTTYEGLRYSFPRFERAFNSEVEINAARQRSGGAERLLSDSSGPDDIGPIADRGPAA